MEGSGLDSIPSGMSAIGH